MGINQAVNDHELKQMLLIPLKVAVEIVLERILKENKQVIMEVVYDAYGTPKYYQNTYEFLDAWDIAVHSSKAIHTSDIQGSFFYRPNSFDGSSLKGESSYQGGMRSTPPGPENNYMGQHHGIGGIWGDSRQYLADIIYQGIQGGKIYGDGPYARKRDAFSQLLKIVGKRNFNNWMKEAMQEVGLNVKSHGGIQVKNE